MTCLQLGFHNAVHLLAVAISIAVSDELFVRTEYGVFLWCYIFPCGFFQLNSLYRSIHLCFCPKVTVRNLPGKISPD